MADSLLLFLLLLLRPASPPPPLQVTQRISLRLDQILSSNVSTSSLDLNPLSSLERGTNLHNPQQSLADDKNESILMSQITSLLTTLSDVTASMSTLVERSGSSGGGGGTTGGTSNPLTSPNSGSALLVRRYREIAFDYSSDFKKIKQNLTKKREAVELFTRSTPDPSRGGGTSSSSSSSSSYDSSSDPAMRQLLRERSALNNSLNSSRDVLSQAAASFNELRNQRASLLRSGTGVSALGGMSDNVGKLIDKIRRKKTKDQMVLAGVISSLVLFTLWYMFG